jgi:ribonucleoside-triphosphate reductase
MVRVIGEVVAVGKRLTCDIEVEDTKEYPIWVDGKLIISHNTVSLLGGASPGVHYPISRYHIRRVRMNKDMELVKQLAAAGYVVESCVGSEKTTVVVEFPVDIGEGVRVQGDVSIWEKVRLTEFMQRYWSDNQVSVTIDFDPATESSQVKPVLEYAQYGLKSVSFLPRRPTGSYPQMPYEEITAEQYAVMKGRLLPIGQQGQGDRGVDVEQDMFCDGDVCVRAASK